MKLEQVLAVRKTKTVYRDGDRCIKVFVESHPKSNILNEALNVARIEETGIRIPKLLEVTSIEGRWALVFEYIEGDTLATLMERNPEKKGRVSGSLRGHTDVDPFAHLPHADPDQGQNEAQDIADHPRLHDMLRTSLPP